MQLAGRLVTERNGKVPILTGSDLCGQMNYYETLDFQGSELIYEEEKN